MSSIPAIFITAFGTAISKQHSMALLTLLHPPPPHKKSNNNKTFELFRTPEILFCVHFTFTIETSHFKFLASVSHVFFLSYKREKTKRRKITKQKKTSVTLNLRYHRFSLNQQPSTHRSITRSIF